MLSIFETFSLLSEKQSDGLDKDDEKQKDPDIEDSEKTPDTEDTDTDTDNIEDPEMPEDAGMDNQEFGDDDTDTDINNQDVTDNSIDDTSMEDNPEGEIENTEDDIDINKKIKLLEAYKKLYTDTEELINQITNILPACNNMEYKALQTSIDNLYKIKEILYNYILDHYNKSEYSENLYYYISSVRSIKITKKIIDKILEIRNKH